MQCSGNFVGTKFEGLYIGIFNKFSGMWWVAVLDRHGLVVFSMEVESYTEIAWKNFSLLTFIFHDLSLTILKFKDKLPVFIDANTPLLISVSGK